MRRLLPYSYIAWRLLTYIIYIYIIIEVLLYIECRSNICGFTGYMLDYFFIESCHHREVAFIKQPLLHLTLNFIAHPFLLLSLGLAQSTWVAPPLRVNVAFHLTLPSFPQLANSGHFLTNGGCRQNYTLLLSG